MKVSEARPVRLHLAAACVAVMLLGIAVRLAQLSLVDGARLAEIARRQHTEVEAVQSLRGSILDRAGEPLAVTVPAGSVFLRPKQLPAGTRGEEVARLLGVPLRTFARKAADSAPFVWVKRQASPETVEILRALNVPGVGIVAEPRRIYPHANLAAPVVGFAGIDAQGLEGVELAYDSLLRGPSAALDFERDGVGRKILVRGDGKAVPRQGADVTLTIDSALQFVAERELDAKVRETGAKGGLALVLNPHSGEILALAQSPSFDPNQIHATKPQDWRNRAVTDAYEPGSTLKGLLVAAALEEKIVRPDDQVFCENGVFVVAGRKIHDHHPHGWLSVGEVLQVSSNIGAAKIAARLGAKRYAQRLRAFGLGQTIGVDLPGEQAGLVRAAAEWKPIDLATASYGHGVAVTPMQLAAAYAALANGGILMKPFIVKRVTDESGTVVLENQPTVVRRVVSEETARRVTGMLQEVVTRDGTAPAAAIPGIRVAGKTGTAQKVDLVRGGYSRGRIASFVGYLPADDPEVLALVVVDDPQTTTWGGTAAAPVFREIAAVAVERLGIRATSAAAGEVIAPQAEPAHPALPTSEASFVGLSLREAVERAERAGILVEVRGSGYVVRQEPPAGRALEPGQALRLELAAAEESLR